MRNSYKLAFAGIVFVFAIADRASAQITITYDATYPKAGAVKGQIAVQGKINIPAGTVGQTAGTGRLYISPVGGGASAEFPYHHRGESNGKRRLDGNRHRTRWSEL